VYSSHALAVWAQFPIAKEYSDYAVPWRLPPVGYANAGAKYVISSLWNIPTKPSVLLMNKFFEIYQSTTKPTPAVALAQAQAYIRNITFGKLNSSSIGREIIKELLVVRVLSSLAEPIGTIIPTDDVKPLADPNFWGAWIFQG
jgi:CHAT domain-containing protein